MFPKEKENYNHTSGWEINTFIHHKLYKNMHQQIGGNPFSGFCFFANSFLNTFPIPREWQYQGKLTENYNQNTWWVGFGVSLPPTPTSSTDIHKDQEVSSVQEEKMWDFKHMDSKSVECWDWYYTNHQTCKHFSQLHEQSSHQDFLFIVGAGITARGEVACFASIYPRKGGMEIQDKISRVLRTGLTVYSSILW